jgi:hypothetical protein
MRRGLWGAPINAVRCRRDRSCGASDACESACITLPVLQKHLRVSGLRGGEDFSYFEITDRIRDTPPRGVLYCTVTLSAHA